MDPIVVIPMKDYVVGHVIANSVVQFLVVLVVSARFVSRIKFGSGVGADDWLILAATILSIGLLTIIGLLSSAGAGYPIAEVMVNLQVILKMTFATVPIYISTLTLTKLSMLFFYRRIFENATTLLYVNMTIGFVLVWGVAHFLANIFICNPVAGQYDLAIAATATCGNQITLFQSLIVSNIIGDIIIMILPMRTIWSLNMRKTEKVGLTASFLLLGCVVVVGAVRVHYVSTTDMRGDISGTMPIALFLTCIEPNFGILCVSIPMLRPIYTRYRAKYSSTLGSGDKYASNSGGVRLHSFDRPSKKASQNDQGVDTMIEQLGQQDNKFSVRVNDHDTPSIESDDSTREIAPQSPKGAIGVQTRWEVKVGQK